MSTEKIVNYVSYILGKVNANDKGFRAKMRRADNPETEDQSWEFLAKWIDLTNEPQRKAYGLIGASMARLSNSTDGKIGLGRALQQLAFSKKVDNLFTSAEARRLRRILACQNSIELISVLRPILNLLDTNGITYDHAQLLDDILRFDYDQSRNFIRAHWAQEFYGQVKKETT